MTCSFEDFRKLYVQQEGAFSLTVAKRAWKVLLYQVNRKPSTCACCWEQHHSMVVFVERKITLYVTIVTTSCSETLPFVQMVTKNISSSFGTKRLARTNRSHSKRTKDQMKYARKEHINPPFRCIFVAKVYLMLKAKNVCLQEKSD